MSAEPTLGIDGEIDYFDHRLNAADEEGVARLGRRERERRVSLLMDESNAILDYALKVHVWEKDKDLAAICGLFSGGNDSTVLCHLMLPRITVLLHANTTIGIEETRQFVRDTAALWDKPLLMMTSRHESDSYANLVRASGFPAQGLHWKMYSRLKERALDRMRAELLTNRRKQRLIFLAGRRRTESARRANVPMMQPDGSAIWVSPMVNWTKWDLNTYRLMHDVPVNRVSDLIHMSGECLCGAFAHAGELEEIGEWFPDVVAEIRALEAEIADRPDIPEKRKTWGWGATHKEKPSRVGAMCSSCDARWVQEEMK